MSKQSTILHKSLLYFVVVFISAEVANAQAVWTSSRSNNAQVRLATEFYSIAPETERLHAAIQFKFKSGWHIYWKNPGSIGLPPKVQWKLPANWSADALNFPPPFRFPDPKGIQPDSQGYTDFVSFPVILSGPAMKQKSEWLAQAKIEFLICEVQCIPDSVMIERKLPVRAEEFSTERAKVNEAFSLLPRIYDSEKDGLEITWDSNKTVRLYFGEGLAPVDDLFIAFPEGTPRFFERETKITKVTTNSFEVVFPEPVTSFEWTSISQTETKRSSAYGIISRPEMSGARFFFTTEFWLALFFAFLGGLILNLMPCVLPVLTLKTVSLIEVAEHRNARSNLLFTALGIWLSFLILALLTIALQSAGAEVGWGFQFQSPTFISFMILVIFIFSLNLFDFFHFEIPTHTHSTLAKAKSPLLEGMFASLLATPCSAPFLGTALTYALAQPPLILGIFFLTMGIGLSSPYLIFYISPRSLKIFPRPGKWMHGLKSFLGYSLLLAVLWLLYVLNQQASGILIVGLLLSLLLVFICIREIKHRIRWVLIALIGASSLFMVHDYQALNASSSHLSKHTEFTPSFIQEQTAMGKRLLVIVTADWCLTCKYNEKFVIETAWMKNLLSENNIELVIFDWTQKNEQIGDFLKSYGRVAIPFAMFIDANRNVLLPELLTKQNTLEGLEEFTSED